MTTVFKIRRSDGTFSMGGSDPRFNKVGKIWKQRGHLTSHLTCVADYGRKGMKLYADCEVVQYELTETQVGEAISIFGYLQERAHKKFLAEQEQKLRQEANSKQSRYNEYVKLQREFGDNVDT